MGIDVGDLHRVIQIDAPATVAGFLQRMGRSGRRPGTRRNCLFLATDDGSLLRAAGLIGLWAEEDVEPVVPPPEPYHIFAQQVMALCLQERGLGRRDWPAWLGGVPAFASLPEERAREILAWMRAEKIRCAQARRLPAYPRGRFWASFVERVLQTRAVQAAQGTPTS